MDTSWAQTAPASDDSNKYHWDEKTYPDNPQHCKKNNYFLKLHIVILLY